MVVLGFLKEKKRKKKERRENTHASTSSLLLFSCCCIAVHERSSWKYDYRFINTIDCSKLSTVVFGN